MLRDQLLLAWRLRPSPLMQVVAQAGSEPGRSPAICWPVPTRSALPEMEAWLEKRRR